MGQDYGKFETQASMSASLVNIFCPCRRRSVYKLDQTKMVIIKGAMVNLLTSLLFRLLYMHTLMLLFCANVDPLTLHGCAVV